MAMTMTQKYQVHEMTSDEFHTLALEGWHEPHLGVALVFYEPWLSTFLLAHKCRNRPLSPTELQRLRDAFVEDRWFLTGETLIFNAAIENMDGQHRLTTSVETDTPFQSLTVWGIEPDAFVGIDIGKKRSGADQLAAAEVPDYVAMAAALRLYYRLEHKAMRATNIQLPDHQIMPYLLTHQKVRYSLSYGQRAHTFLVPSLGSALHYALHSLHASMADQLFDDLINGENLVKRDPVYILRDLLGIRRPHGQRTRQASDVKTKADMAAQVIEVWNAMVTHKTVSLKGLQTVGERPFPEIVVPSPESAL